MRNLPRMIVCIVVALVLSSGAAFAAKKEEKNEYPNATRAEPKTEMSAATQKDLNKALDLINSNKDEEAQPLLQKVLDDQRKAFYSQLGD